MTEFCLNNNAGGVYPKFDVTFINTTGAAAPSVPPQTSTVGAGNASAGKTSCLCSKCRPA